MFVPSSAVPTKSFPPLDDLLEFLSSISYRKHAVQFILIVATIAAIVVGVTTFAYKASRKLWLEHGEEIILNFLEFVNRVEIAIESAYELGVSFRPVAAKWANFSADRAFYFACEVV